MAQILSFDFVGDLPAVAAPSVAARVVIPEAPAALRWSASATVVRGVRRDSVACSWCAGCDLDGLCDHDECASRPETDFRFYERLYKGGALFASRQRFPNLGSYIDLLKSQNWL